MFYLIGLGLGDAKDITVRGLEVVKKAKRVYLEAYTSMLTVGKDALEEFYGREVIVADRDMVEQESDVILEGADIEDIAFLVVGDPFGATTHTDLVLRAKEQKIPFKVVHNASIMNAIGCCGLQLYNFGETVSIVFWTDTWQPDSFYDKIAKNRKHGLHTLCLLDIKVKEQSIENLMNKMVVHDGRYGTNYPTILLLSTRTPVRLLFILDAYWPEMYRGRKVYEPPRYMTVAQAADQLMQIIQKKQATDLAFTEDTVCIGVARVGSDHQSIVATTLRQMTEVDIGGPLHSLVITGDMHPLELQMLNIYADDSSICPS